MSAMPFTKRYFLHFLILINVVFWVLAAIEPFNRKDWMLENALVVIFAVILCLRYKKMPLSNTSYLMLSIFLSAHLLGSHYTYSEVPIGHWAKEYWGLTRNHYDRLVHFAFGLFLAYPFTEIIIRSKYSSRVDSAWKTFLIIFGMSVGFEVVEVITAYIVSPELGMAYLGTQGDSWDAVKDVLCAVAGSAVAIWLLPFTYKRTALSH